MKSEIILNCFPPAYTMKPSPALSILKSFITFHGYRVDVKYWNCVFESYRIGFIEGNTNNFDEYHANLLPFINYLWVQNGKKLNNSNIKNLLLAINPSWYNLGTDYVEKKMMQYANDLEQIITTEILKANLETYQIFGVTAKFNQWICGGIVAQKVKKLFPEIKIVVGGFGTYNEALAMMNNFDYYDYAIWGEGEYPLLHLCEAIDSSSYSETPCLIYRDKDSIPQISMSKKKQYFDFNSGIFPDYSDFFTQKQNNMGSIRLPFELSRGCHWNKCRFCYESEGYKYRTKSNENKIKELKHQIEKYNILKFSSVGNDDLGNNIDMFEDFLDDLIKLKQEYPEFSIDTLEIITKNITSTIIKKMALGGVRYVQIGYESPSNKLLQKIKKKNTFASNLLFIKWAKEFYVSVVNANVIQGLLEETADDIFEATENLFYLRFFLSKKVFRHNMIPLKINKSSSYFQELEKNNKLPDWNVCFLSELLPDNFHNQEDRYNLFDYENKNAVAMQWKIFNKVESHYINSKYDYKIINNKDVIYYREYLDNTLINELAFEDRFHWDVLQSCNHKVISLKELCTSLPLFNTNDIMSAIESLKSEGLLYHNDDFSEIVTPINTDVINVNLLENNNF